MVGDAAAGLSRSLDLILLTNNTYVQCVYIYIHNLKQNIVKHNKIQTNKIRHNKLQYNIIG